MRRRRGSSGTAVRRWWTVAGLLAAAVLVVGLLPPAAAAAATDQLRLTVSSPRVTEGDQGTKEVVFRVSGTCAPADGAACDLRGTTINDFTAGVPQADAADYAGRLFEAYAVPSTFSVDVAVTVNGDTTFEPDEQFVLSASLFVGGERRVMTEGTATIVNDDPNPFRIAVSSPRVVEGDTAVVFRVTGTCAPAAPGDGCSFQGSTGNDPASGVPQADPDVDYRTRFVAPAVTGPEFSVDVPVAVIGDTAFEPDEQFRFTASLYSGGGRRAVASGTATIVNDDPAPTAPAAITADAGSGQSAQPGAPFPNPLVARVTTAAGAGVSGAPVTFSVTSGSATFAGGAGSVTVRTGSDGRAPAPLTAGGTPGQVTVGASTPGVTPAATFTETVTAPSGPPRADLTAVLGAPASAPAGSAFVLTLTVTNRGPSTASQVGSRITLPAGVRVVDAGGGAVLRSGQDVGFLRPSLAAGQSVTYRITVGTDRTLRGAQAITGATVATQVPDPNVSDNTTRRVVTITAP